mmetsp:Transcript_29117/g.45250  ORF Transcript_29117/g.45250 Transcript_29117/m.45250 type:complete len:368 (+) Transcript_29117:74-1177(+)
MLHTHCSYYNNIATTLLLLLLTTTSYVNVHVRASTIKEVPTTQTRTPYYDSSSESSSNSTSFTSITRYEDVTTTVKEKSAPYVLTRKDLATAGVIASMVGVSVMHPVDCIKTLQQSGAGKGLNILSAAKKIGADFGLGGFYRGIGPALYTESSAAMLKFPVYEGLKTVMARHVPVQYHSSGMFGCAILAALSASITTVPGEVVKQRLMVGSSTQIGELMRGIFKQNGILGFYAGYAACCLRDVPFTVFQLALYDVVKQLMLKYVKKNCEELTQVDEIICGGITGGITGFLTAPCDLLKTKIMVDGHLYNGVLDCIRKTVEEGGVGSLLNGAGARVAWLTPFNAIYLPIYEVMKRKLEQSGNIRQNKL